MCKGFYLTSLQKRVNAYGIDISGYAIKRIRKLRKKVRLANVEMEFDAKNFFCLIISKDTLPLIKNKIKKVIEEINQCSKNKKIFHTNTSCCKRNKAFLMKKWIKP